MVTLSERAHNHNWWWDMDAHSDVLWDARWEIQMDNKHSISLIANAVYARFT